MFGHSMDWANIQSYVLAVVALAGGCWRSAGGLLAACWRPAGGSWRLLAAGWMWRWLAAAGGLLAVCLLAVAGGFLAACWRRWLAAAGGLLAVCWRPAGGSWRIVMPTFSSLPS
jgi:hypothetical protein